MPRTPARTLVLIAAILGINAAATADTVYASTFDACAIGQTQSHPGDPGQDGWFKVGAGPSSYGEFQTLIANGGTAYHGHADFDTPSGQQTTDARALTAPDLAAKPIITLSIDFQASTSDQSTTNPYNATFQVRGGPHPGFLITGFGLAGGNGMPKSDTLVNLNVTAFNGSDNNTVIPLTVGQQLAWDTWHSLTLVADQANDEWVSITVNGEVQDLTGYQLPRTWDGAEWLRGELIESVISELTPTDWPDNETSDEVYYDNVELTVDSLTPPQVVYASTFDTCTLGQTQSHPGDPGQDGWYKVGAGPSSYGEFQTLIANGGTAYHGHADFDTPSGQQTTDARALTAPDLAAKPIITLSIDFQASTSDQSTTNPYNATFQVRGGPHPGFLITGFGLAGGNGMPKSDTLVNLNVTAFNGSDNNTVIPLTVGQQLAWDTWHTLTLVADQANDEWVSITVNGEVQDLTGYQLPRTWDGAEWLRGELIESVISELTPTDWPDNETSDEVYYDNVELTVQQGEEPPIPGDLDGDGDVDQSDLGILLAAYGINDGGDIDGDGDTDQSDLGTLLSNYGVGT